MMTRYMQNSAYALICLIASSWPIYCQLGDPNSTSAVRDVIARMKRGLETEDIELYMGCFSRTRASDLEDDKPHLLSAWKKYRIYFEIVGSPQININGDTATTQVEVEYKTTMNDGTLPLTAQMKLNLKFLQESGQWYISDAKSETAAPKK